VRLQLEAGQDYRFLLMTKSVGTRDELHISNVDRNTNVMLVENSDVGEILSVSGEGALKVCSKFQMADRGCDWTCSVDLAAGVVTVATKELSAEFAIVCD